VVQPGAIYLAQKAGCPIVPVGVSASRGINLPTWDRYLIPLPFARGAIIYGKCVTIPPDLDDAGRQLYADYAGQLINDLEAQAHELACTGHLPPSNADRIPAPQISAMDDCGR
jgi:lysophospholipid acyltransferase (LPLAT)-like uncharacterized protein